MPRRQRKQTWKSAAANHALDLAGYPSTMEEAIRIIAERLLEGVAQVPTDLFSVASHIGFTNLPKVEAEDPDDTIHDDGLRFYEAEVVYTTEDRADLARDIARHFFATQEPRGFTRGAELERIVAMLAAELLIPSEAFTTFTEGALHIGKILQTAKAFDVSIRTAARRWAQGPYLTIFEVTIDEVNWGYGGVSKGPVQTLETELRAIVSEAMNSPFVEPASFFSAKRPWFGSRRVEWTDIGFNRTLFLVRIPRRDERRT